MSRINWKKKVRNIPAKVQIAPKVQYDITWQKEILNTKGDHLCGFTDFDNKIINIQLGMSPKLTAETAWHECLHAWSHHYNINLTENQVLALEKILPYIDGLFNKGNK